MCRLEFGSRTVPGPGCDLAGCDVAVASGLEGPGYGSGATATLVATATALPAAEVDGGHLDRQESD